MGIKIQNLRNITNIKLRNGIESVVGEWLLSFDLDIDNTYSYSIYKDNINNYYITGHAYANGNGNGFVLKLDESLRIVNSFKSEGHNNLGLFLKDIIIVNDNIFVCGEESTTDVGDGVVIKLDSSLNYISSLVIKGGDSSGNGWYKSYLTDIDSVNGRIVVHGRYHYMNGSEPRGGTSVSSFNEDFSNVRSKSYVGNYPSRRYGSDGSLDVFDDGYVYMSGGIYKSDTYNNYQEHGIFKLDSNTNLSSHVSIRSKRPDSPSQHIVEGQKLLKVGNYFYAFSRVSSLVDNNHCILVTKLNSNFTYNNHLVLGGTAGITDTVADAIVNSDGNILIISDTACDINGSSVDTISFTLIDTNLNVLNEKHLYRNDGEYANVLRIRAYYESNTGLISVPFSHRDDGVVTSGIVNIDEKLTINDGIYGEFTIDSFPLRVLSNDVDISVSFTNPSSVYTPPSYVRSSLTHQTDDLLYTKYTLIKL